MAVIRNILTAPLPGESLHEGMSPRAGVDHRNLGTGYLGREGFCCGKRGRLVLRVSGRVGDHNDGGWNVATPRHGGGGIERRVELLRPVAASGRPQGGDIIVERGRAGSVKFRKGNRRTT